uniref:Cytochrome P450 n=1 Tax=Romanomermis culicivorax TaxID=13658 RepID=A0A915KNZ5_ROMCU
MLTLLFSICLLVILYRIYVQRINYSQKNARTLPGPRALPFLGHLTLFWNNSRQKTYEKLVQLSEEYGQIFGLKFFNHRIIVLTGLDSIKRSMNDWSFADRPDLPTFEAATRDDHGKFHRFSFMKSNRQWKFYRQNSIKALSLFSSSKNSRLQALVEQGCRSLWVDLEQKRVADDENLSSVKDSIFECASGIIGAVNFGLQFDRNDPLLKEIVGFSDRSAKFISVKCLLHITMENSVH